KARCFIVEANVLVRADRSFDLIAYEALNDTPLAPGTTPQPSRTMLCAFRNPLPHVADHVRHSVRRAAVPISFGKGSYRCSLGFACLKGVITASLVPEHSPR